MTTEQNQTFGELNRRDFLQRGSVATLMTMLGAVELVAEKPATEEKTGYSTAGEKVKCAVIGLGSRGREIVHTLMELKQADLVVGCETYSTFLKRLTSLAPNAQQVEDYRKILDDKEIKAVIIATPSHKHREIAIAALQAGKHVYCEAPLATTVDDARAIALEAKNHPEVVFQAGLQQRSDPQRKFLLPFIRSGALGKNVMARAHWHKKQSWRFTSANPEREKEINWRLSQKTSPGLIGEIGVHQLDAVRWFLGALPVSVTGFGSLIQWNDGRYVPDTIQAVIEFPGSDSNEPRKNCVRLIYDATLANSFESEQEVYFGTSAAVLVREHRAWMVKEVDSDLLGWEVYARKDSFFPDKETGIALVADASKLSAQGTGTSQPDPYPETPLHYALESFFRNCNKVTAAVEDFKSNFDANDKEGLAKILADTRRPGGDAGWQPAAGYKEGFEATVMAIRANEAILKGEKIAFEKDWFSL